MPGNDDSSAARIARSGGAACLDSSGKVTITSSAPIVYDRNGEGIFTR